MLETKHFRLECGSKEEDTYVFSVKIPPRSELMQQMEKQAPSVSTDDICFSTGILYNVQHSVKLCFAKPGQVSKPESPKPVNPYEYQPMVPVSPDPSTMDIVVFVSLTPKNFEEVNISGLKLKFVDEVDDFSFGSAERDMKPMGTATKECEYEFGIYKYCNYKYWMWSADTFENISVWTDKITQLRITMNVLRREFKPARFLTETTERDCFLPFKTHGGMLGTKPYFLSENLSDVRIHCGGTEFPAHRLILAARSKYFENQFLSLMGDVPETGHVRLTDCEPSILKEVLRFIYCGEVEYLESIASELLEYADKFLIDELHTMCERHLVTKVNLDNISEMYAIGSKSNAKMLVQVTKKLILSNKDKFLGDSNGFKNFTLKHPELMFELFHMSNVNLSNK